MTSSRRSPALATTSSTSKAVHSVSHALMRTQRIFSPQSWSRMAPMTLPRAASFSSGATESSRSRNTMSAGIPGPLPSIFSLEPGIDRQERRGRLRVRSDMSESYGELRGEQEVGRELLGEQALESRRVTGDERAAERQAL